MKKMIVVLSLIILTVTCITIVQLPSIFAVPTDYSDFEGIVLSEDDNLHNQLPTNFCYSFRTVDDSLIRPYHDSLSSSDPVPSFIAEIYIYTSYGNNINRGVYINDYNNSYPDIEIPTDYKTNPESFWNYIFSISKYWKIYTTETSFYDTPLLYLKPYDYIEPTFNIECNPSQITPGETSRCVLKANYHSKIKSLNFKLDTDLYNISNINAGEEFENLQVNDGVYSLTSKSSLEDSSEGRTVDIISFNVSSNKDTIVSSDNIKVLNLKYVDELVESPTKALAATVNQTKKNNILDLKNPKTKNNFIIVSILLSVILLSIVISIIRNKKTSKIN